MKTVYPTKEIPHIWAHKLQSHARSGNMYFEGDTIYSYGSHFPIARHIQHKGKPAVLFTTQKYSITTSAHCSRVRYAIPGSLPVFNVSDVESNNHAQHLKDYREQITEAIGKALRSHTRSAMLTESAEKLIEEANRYAAFFELATRFNIGKEREILKKRLAEQKSRSKRQLKKWLETAPQERAKAERELDRRISLWTKGDKNIVLAVRAPSLKRAGEYISISPKTQLLRVNGEKVETSLGSGFPLTHVPRLLELVRRCRETKTEYHHNGHSEYAGSYRIDSIDSEGNVKAGCHFVSWDEIERFAKTLS